MRWGHSIAGSAVIAALIATSITPAAARRGYGGWHHRHHDRNDIDAGDVLTGILILGGIAAIASAASRKREPATRHDYPAEGSSSAGRIASEDAAVDACAAAAERRVSGDGRNGHVREISSVDPVDDGWEVHGVVESRQGYRTGYDDRRGFTCSVRYGQIEQIELDSSVAVR